VRELLKRIKNDKYNSNEKDIIIRSPDVLHQVGLGATYQERIQTEILGREPGTGGKNEPPREYLHHEIG
jgi:hypothetical protein